MTFKGPLEDRIAIFELQNKYCDAVTRFDEYQYISCWHPEGSWSKFGETFKGRNAISEELHLIMTVKTGSLKCRDIIVITSIPGFIEIEGKSGRGRAYTHEISEREDGNITNLYGVYNDTYTFYEGQWLFSSRDFSIMHSNTRKNGI